MDEFQTFREALRDVLLHLYHPGFEPSDVLCEVVGCDPVEGSERLREILLESIRDLEVTLDAPPDSRSRRGFEALHKRFVLGYTQEKTAECLHMSVRNVQRIQVEALDVVAKRLWRRRSVSERSTQADQAPDWRKQTDLELASLRMRAPGAVSDVAETINGVLEVGNVLASRHGFRLKLGFVQPHLVAAIHPAALRQTLITAIGRLAQHISTGQMTIFANLEDGLVKITIIAPIAAGDAAGDETLLRDIIVPPKASVGVDREGERVFLRVRAPSVDERTVLVVEDNPDMVHFYRRCTAGTPYRIVHVAPGQNLVDQIESAVPDIIVLDVMLPDVDGWQLLTHLHERPLTKSVPVIVCSVVKEEELALALGAARFLSKPIQPRRFVGALDQVLDQALAEASTAPANNVATS